MEIVRPLSCDHLSIMVIPKYVASIETSFKGEKSKMSFGTLCGYAMMEIRNFLGLSLKSSFGSNEYYERPERGLTAYTHLDKNIKIDFRGFSMIRKNTIRDIFYFHEWLAKRTWVESVSITHIDLCYDFIREKPVSHFMKRVSFKSDREWKLTNFRKGRRYLIEEKSDTAMVVGSKNTIKCYEKDLYNENEESRDQKKRYYKNIFKGRAINRFELKLNNTNYLEKMTPIFFKSYLDFQKSIETIWTHFYLSHQNLNAETKAEDPIFKSYFSPFLNRKKQ